MDKFANIFTGALIYILIGGLALATLFIFAYVLVKIKSLKSRIEDDRRRSGGRKEYSEGGIRKEAGVVQWEDTLDYMEIFNHIRLKYSMAEQFIPIFPLLGILGTVSGLIQKLTDIAAMSDALGTSMWTTFWGLIAAIGFKVIDAIWISSAVDDMALYFDTYEQNYQMVKDKKRQEENRE